MEDPDAFCDALGKLGFDVLPPRKEGAFIRVRAVKDASKPHPELVLPFRGR